MSKLKINIPNDLLKVLQNAKPLSNNSANGDIPKKAEKIVDSGKVKINTKNTSKPSNVAFTRSSNRGK